VRRLRDLGAPLASGLLAASVLGTTPVGAQDEVTLDLWNVGATGLEELVTQYDEGDPAVAVQHLSRGIDEHHEALLSALATGDVPDIAAIDVSYGSLFEANPENFVDLRTLGAEALEADYVPWRWAQGVVADGRIIGIPTDLGAIAMCYRTDLLEAAGLPTAPDELAALWPDWDSFIEVGERFVENSDAAFIDSAYGTIFNLVGRQGSDLYYGDDGSLVYETGAQVRKAFETSLAGIEAGLSANVDQFSPEWTAALADGDFAVLGCPAWMTNVIQSLAPDTAGRWGITRAPEGGGSWGGTQLAIPAASDHPQEAYAVIEWLLSPENQLEAFKSHGNFPSTPELYDSPDVQDFTNDFFPGVRVGEIFADSAKAARPILEGPQQRAIDREFEAALVAVEDGSLAVEAAWDTALQNVALAIQS
jgi:cellobiose transport system substrate-binding protein